MDDDLKFKGDGPDAFINRELSWLDFAHRVLELAHDQDLPLLERVKFAGIMGMIYDEFAMKRIGGLCRQLADKGKHTSTDGLTPKQELNQCRDELNRQVNTLSQLVAEDLRPRLAEVGIPLLDYDDLDAAKTEAVNAVFRESIEPILTPLSVDMGHPFPFISNLSLNLAVTRSRPGKCKWRFIRIKVPTNRPRWIEVPGGGYVPLEQVIARNLPRLLPDGGNWDCHFFRVTRGAKDDPWDRLPADT
ncbi:MAG: RNA degradosome polyphosphate kinase, partial [bacterium]|nr:RNA degradosome polyphosphate kinase [bacterium]